jgi:hypothetical protein
MADRGHVGAEEAAAYRTPNLAAADGGGRRPDRGIGGAKFGGAAAVEIGGDRCQVMVPQTHPPAAEAEVDFGEFTASTPGV